MRSSVEAHQPAGEPSVDRPRTVWLFVGLAAANLIATASQNTWVLTDDVYRAFLGGATARNEALIDMSRGWELIGYGLGPMVLFCRVAGVALLVHLILLLLGLRPGLARVFRAGLWAQLSLLVGSLAQMVLLATTPTAGRTPDLLRVLPWTAMGLFPDPGSVGPALALLLERITVFDLGWIALFGLALEHRDEAPLLQSLVAVGVTALLILVVQWTGSLYIARLG
jgi:hypothetical protein